MKREFLSCCASGAKNGFEFCPAQYELPNVDCPLCSSLNSEKSPTSVIARESTSAKHFVPLETKNVKILIVRRSPKLLILLMLLLCSPSREGYRKYFYGRLAFSSGRTIWTWVASCYLRVVAKILDSMIWWSLSNLLHRVVCWIFLSERPGSEEQSPEH